MQYGLTIIMNVLITNDKRLAIFFDSVKEILSAALCVFSPRPSAVLDVDFSATLCNFWI